MTLSFTATCRSIPAQKEKIMRSQRTSKIAAVFVTLTVLVMLSILCGAQSAQAQQQKLPNYDLEKLKVDGDNRIHFGIKVTIDSSKHGQIKTSAKEFRYYLSARDLAGQSTSMTAAEQATSGRGASAERAMRRASEPVIISGPIDNKSQFFQSAAANGELLPAVLIEFTRPNGNGQTEVFQTVRLTNAMVSSVKMSGGQNLMEEVSFTFQKIEYNHKDGLPSANDNWNTGEALSPP
jgi:type VI secretion system Hcp family effector